MKKEKTFFEFLCDISTKPDITSYKWARRAYSILATAALWIVWAFRLVSAYQWVKNLFRAILGKIKKGYVENASGRAEVPPCVGEIYFLLGTLIHGIAYILGISNGVLNFLAIYFIFETSVWILYYTVFRRFFELGYTIYHQLEYIMTMIILVPTQALCFARIFSISFTDAFLALIGVGGDAVPLIVKVFGYLLTAIIISMIISTFPEEKVKPCVKKSKMFVIGCGDVVRKRLYPALCKSVYTVKTLIYDIEPEKKEEKLEKLCYYCSSNEEILKVATVKDQLKKKNDETEFEDVVDKNSVVWLETPPQHHISYLNAFLQFSKAGLIVLEKPITNSEKELQGFEESIKGKRNRIFFLSYYVLEKALPLSFLAALAEEKQTKDKKKIKSKIYSQYLDYEKTTLIDNWQDVMGDLQKVAVNIHEGVDPREWLNDESQGGHLFETFLHNMLIAALFCGSPKEWKINNFTNADYTKSLKAITMNAETTIANKNVDITLTMEKGSTSNERAAEFVFENGKITADFNTQSVEVNFEKLEKVEKICVNKDYLGKYQILTDLVGRVMSAECTSKQIDGFKNQIDALNVLHREKNNPAV